MKLKLFGCVRIDEALDLARSISTKKLNEQVKRNWNVLMRVIVAALYLVCQEQAFREHNEAAGNGCFTSHQQSCYSFLLRMTYRAHSPMSTNCLLMLTIPDTSTSAEPSFSCLKRI